MPVPKRKETAKEAQSGETLRSWEGPAERQRQDATGHGGGGDEARRGEDSRETPRKDALHGP